MTEITLALIKPDAVQARVASSILREMEDNFIIGDVVAARWSRTFASRFYEEHAMRPFFPSLVQFMTMDTVYAVTLIGDNAILRWRQMMGATDPKLAEPGTIREKYGSKTLPIMYNAVHGSDSEASMFNEIDMLTGWLTKGYKTEAIGSRMSLRGRLLTGPIERPIQQFGDGAAIEARKR